MANLSELISYLADCNLHPPTEDEWESFKLALTPFIDCWYGGAKASFQTYTHTLVVRADNEDYDQTVCVIAYDTNKSIYGYNFIISYPGQPGDYDCDAVRIPLTWDYVVQGPSRKNQFPRATDV